MDGLDLRARAADTVSLLRQRDGDGGSLVLADTTGALTTATTGGGLTTPK